MPIEIKPAATFEPDFTKNIEKFRKVAGEKVSENYFVLYGGKAFPAFK
jgi:hypothetical protein